MILTVDGDWNEYFAYKRPALARRPPHEAVYKLIQREIKTAAWAKVKLLHFIHTSDVSGDVFLRPEFIELWKQIESSGGSVGIHCHDETLVNLSDEARHQKRAEAIASLTNRLRQEGLNIISYRGGYLAFSNATIPMLEQNGLALDFSCDPGRHLLLEGKLVADWQGAPHHDYPLSYDDYRQPGNSRVREIPLGKSKTGSLYIDVTSLFGIWKGAHALAREAKLKKRDIMVGVLTHTYEWESWWKQIKIGLALLICKCYGTFINDREALAIIRQKNGEDEQ